MEGLRDARAVLEAIHEGVLVVGGGGEVRYLNRPAATLLGTEPRDALGRSWREVLRAADALPADLEAALSGTAAPPGERTAPHRVRLEGGVEADVEVVVLPDRRGERRVVLLLDDVGDEAEAERARQEFIYMIVHDLNTPLQSIVGFAELLLMERSGPLDDTQRDFLRRIEAGGWQMTELVRHILDVTQLESGSVDLDRGTVEPFPLVRRALSALEERGVDPGRVANEVPPDLPSLHGDAERLRAALVTVLARALEVSVAPVRVRGEADPDGAVRLHVEDAGPAPDPAAARHLFDAEWTVRRARDAVTRRRALALAVVRLVVEGHGGTVEATPLPDGGTRVSLFLPCPTATT